MFKKCYILIIFCLASGLASGATVSTGGWSITGVGSGESQAESSISTCGSDPSISLGITSTSSVFGPGNFSDMRSGELALNLLLGGFKFSVGFDGSVDSRIGLLGPGTGSISSYVGATATGLSTGHALSGEDSYDIFGSADINTKGYLVGEGSGNATASGSSEYQVLKVGTTSEVYGNVAGVSNLTLEGGSSDSLASTGGMTNGLHAESRSTQTILSKKTASSLSSITGYASVANDARAVVYTSGTAGSGAWSSDTKGTKISGENENSSSQASGEISGYAESNGYLDAADISSIIQSKADRDPRLYVSGGPASYAAVTQNSTSTGTHASVFVNNAIWSSSARSEPEQLVKEFGDLRNLSSEVSISQANTSALTFGKVLLYGDHQTNGTLAAITGNFSLDTYAEATKNSSSFASTSLGIFGHGNVSSEDSRISGEAGFTGNLTSFSNLNKTVARAANKVEYAFVTTNPLAFEEIKQPIKVDTISDPMLAWSRTEGAFISIK